MHRRCRILALLLALALCLSTAATASEGPAEDEAEEIAPVEETLPEADEQEPEAEPEPEQEPEAEPEPAVEPEPSEEPEEEPEPEPETEAWPGEPDYWYYRLEPAYDGVSNEEICYRFLTETMGLNTAAACGILANIDGESNFDPTATGDGNTSYGICQWHDWGTDTGRFTNLKSFCAANRYDYRDLTAQLYYLQYELNQYGFTYIRDGMKQFPNTAEGAYDAGYYWCKEFGRPFDSGLNAKRGALARDYYFPKYASYSAVEYEVTFDADGGAAVPKRTVAAGGTLSSIPLTVRGGYSFDGWYTQKNGGGTKLTSDTVIGGDITYYAHWLAPEKFAVKFDANGGSGTPMPQSKTQGTALSITATKPKRKNYTFLGWAESPDAQAPDYLPGGSYTKDASVTLYAVWQFGSTPGDTDADGVFTPLDAAGILALVGTNDPGADADGSGIVTAFDALLVLRGSVGL